NFTRIVSKLIKSGFKRIYSMALINRSAIVNYLKKYAVNDGLNLLIVPAGVQARAFEDLVGAMYLVKLLLDDLGKVDMKLNGISSMYFRRDFLDSLKDAPEFIKDFVMVKSKHARYLMNQGGILKNDVSYCLQLDLNAAVPVLDPTGKFFINKK
ncbi:MAG: 2-phosphosulfolactate phosphatase, partial [Promethearchaeota archaeon]